MKNYQVTFSENEISVLVQMCDIAVRSQGLSAAEAALVLVNKLKQAPELTEPKIESSPEPEGQRLVTE